MSWWKRLRPWHRGGVVMAAFHIIVYSFLIILIWDYYSYFVTFIEYPWLLLLKIFGVSYPGDLAIFPYGLVIGTIFYGLLGSFLGYLMGRIVKEK